MQSGKKKWLNEVSFIRPILLVMLVSYHAFAPYVGTWDLPEGIHGVESYKWLGLLSKAFRMEGFVFISGYIFTFQILDLGKFDNLKSLVVSKVNRLLIPSIVFSTLYFLCFKQYDGVVPFLKSVIGGTAHLWYLPCLFWCFIIQYVLLKKTTLSLRFCIPVLVLATAISFVNLPLNLNKPLYYMLFFYGGGLFYRYSSKLSEISTNKNIALSWLVFALFFVAFNLLMQHGENIIATSGGSLVKSGVKSVDALLKATLGWSGIFAIYLTAAKYCKTHQIGKTIIKIGACDYGVYVFHQFILVALYSYTSLPDLIGTYWLPWVGLVITVAVSVALTLLVRSTKIGRKYL